MTATRNHTRRGKQRQEKPRVKLVLTERIVSAIAFAVSDNGYEKWFDDAQYLVHSIFSRQIRRKDEREDRFLPCSYKRWAKIVSERKLFGLIKTLIEFGILECDGTYAIGAKFLGYRVCEGFMPKENEDLFFVNLEHGRLSEKINAFRKKSDLLLSPLDRKLKTLFEDNLTIDSVSAYERLRASEGKSAKSLTSAAWAISAIEEGDANYGVCSQGRRFTSLTSLPRALRNDLRVGVQKLNEVDVQNSQPLTLAAFFFVLLNKKRHRKYIEICTQYATNSFIRNQQHANANRLTENLEERKEPVEDIGSDVEVMYGRSPVTQGRVGIEYRPYCDDNLRQVYTTSSKEAEFRRKYEDIFSYAQWLARTNSAQLENYASLVQSGGFYERIYFRVYGQEFPDEAARGEFKETVFAQILYGKPHYESKIINAFREMFPAVHALICLMKSIQFEVLPRLMQRIESEIVIETAAKEFLRMSGGHFLATVHDSFFVLDEDAHLAKACLGNAFARYGLYPKCRLKQSW